MEFTNQYLTYDKYLEYGGKLQQMPFNLLEFEARKKIDNATFSRLVNLESQKQEVKLCVFALIEDMSASNGVYERESIDGYSYSKLDQKSLKTHYNEVIRTYLGECKLEDGTPYLYCGVE